jgi:membrane-anchored protein YejM (alkaline phosphatase superfamily)
MKLTPKNIILITIDCLRYEAVNNKNMPFLYNFGNHYKQVYSTHGWTRDSLDSVFHVQNPPTLAEELRQNGFTTIGISLNPQCGKRWFFDRGFDVFLDFIDLTTEQKIKDDLDDISYLYGMISPYLEKYKDKPKFVWIHAMDCHYPYYGTEWGDMDMRTLMTCVDITPEKVERIKEKYYNAVKHVDQELEKILNDLKDYLVIISADHGEEFMEEGQLGHRDDYELNEYNTHIPFIVGRV